MASSFFGTPATAPFRSTMMQALGALLEPVLRHRRGIFREHRGRVHLALLQADAMPVLDVDRGNDLHGGGYGGD